MILSDPLLGAEEARQDAEDLLIATLGATVGKTTLEVLLERAKPSVGAETNITEVS